MCYLYHEALPTQKSPVRTPVLVDLAIGTRTRLRRRSESRFCVTAVQGAQWLSGHQFDELSAEESEAKYSRSILLEKIEDLWSRDV